MAWPQTDGYCTPDHVNAMASWQAKTGYSVTTTPTLAAVQGWITETSQMIDSRAARLGFTVPATTGAGYSATTISVLQTWSSMGAAGRAVMATENKVLEPGQRTTGRLLWADFLKWLNDDEQIAAAFSQADTTTSNITFGADADDPCDDGPLFSVRERW